MFCNECGHEVPDNAKFCFECGAKIIRKVICSNCGTELAPNAKFCLECGAKVGGLAENTVKTDMGEDTYITQSVDAEDLLASDNKERQVGIRVEDTVQVENRDAVVTLDDDTDSSDIKNYDVLGGTVSYSALEMDLYDWLDSFSKCASDHVMEEYAKLGGLKGAVDNLPGIYKRTYRDVASTLAKDIASMTQRYDIDTEAIINCSASSFHYMEDLCDELEEHYNDISMALAEAKRQRELRKEERSRVSGGGFGLSGGLKGMAIAGAINMGTGLAHSAFNAVDGALTDGKYKDAMRDVYNSGRDHIYGAIYSDLQIMVLKAADKYLWQAPHKYMISNENTKRANAIFEALTGGRVPNNLVNQQIVMGLSLSIRSRSHFVDAYILTGDPNNEIVTLAEKLDYSDVLERIQEIKDAEKIEQLSAEFACIDNTNREALLAFKADIAELICVQNEKNLLERVNKAIYDAEEHALNIKVQSTNFIVPDEVAALKEFLKECGYHDVLCQKYTMKMLDEKFAVIDKNDRSSLLAFMDKITGEYNIGNEYRLNYDVEKAIFDVELSDVVVKYEDIDFNVKESVENFNIYLSSSGYHGEIIDAYQKKVDKMLRIISEEKEIAALYDNVDKSAIEEVVNFIKVIDTSSADYLPESKNDFIQAAVELRRKLEIEYIESEIQKADANNSVELKLLAKAFASQPFIREVKDEYNRKIERLITARYAAIRHLCSGMTKEFDTYSATASNGSFYHYDRLDKKKVSNFQEEFEKRCGLGTAPVMDLIVAYHDKTFFGGGDEGFAVTPYGIYGIGDKKCLNGFIAFSDMTEAPKIDKGFFGDKLIVNCNKGKIQVEYSSKKRSDEAVSALLENLYGSYRMFMEAESNKAFFAAHNLEDYTPKEIKISADSEVVLKREIPSDIGRSDSGKTNDDGNESDCPDEEGKSLVSSVLSKEILSEHKGNYDVVLVDAGSSKINVIKLVRQYCNLGLREAKCLVDDCPSPLLQGIDDDLANEIKNAFADAGAYVRVE